MIEPSRVAPDPQAAVTESIQTTFGLDPETQGKILLSLLSVLAVWAIRWLLLRTVAPRFDDPRVRYRWTKGTGYVAFVLLLLLLSQIWLEAIRGLGTFLGLLSAGLAIALRDLVASLAGWAFILLRHPFVVGDRIQIGEHRGDVVDIRLFQFTLLEVGNWVHADQSTGRLIHVPNGQVFTDPLANYTVEFPYVWHELPVAVTFESDWRRAKEILGEAVARHAGGVPDEAEETIRQGARSFLIYYGTKTPKVYTALAPHGVELTLRFLCPVRQRRGMSEKIWESVLDAFAADPSVQLAYPTQRVFVNPLGEGGHSPAAPARASVAERGQPHERAPESGPDER